MESLKKGKLYYRKGFPELVGPLLYLGAGPMPVSSRYDGYDLRALLFLDRDGKVAGYPTNIFSNRHFELVDSQLKDKKDD